MATKPKSAPKQTSKKAAKPRTIKVVEGDGSDAKPAEGTKPKPEKKKLSALDAAAKILADAKAPMSCKDLIEAMTAKGLWSSPGGKTPQATLYSAIIRELKIKGKEARFAKVERGKFASA